MKRAEVSTAIFGGSDGLLAAVAIVLASSSRGRDAVLLALFGLFVAEGLGMAASQYLADVDTSLRKAAVMGVSTAGAILLVAVPWLLATGGAAVAASMTVAVVLGAAIAQLRPGGFSTWAQTFGVLAAVAGISAAGGHL